jgi:hypothetical protein
VRKNIKMYYLKLKKKMFNLLASQLANVLYSIKYEYKFPLRYPVVWMSMSGTLLRLFVTEDPLITTVFSVLIASLIHFLAVGYILYYILPDKKKMKMFVNFIRNHREDPVIK